MQNKHVKLILSFIIGSCINICAANKLSITFPRNGSTVINNNKKLTFKGTVFTIPVFGGIIVTIDGKSLGYATLNKAHTEWSITTKTSLSNGVHKVVAKEYGSRFGAPPIATATSTFTLVASAPQPKTNNSSCYSCKPCCR